jgi:histidine ammonia-lyase
LPSSAFKLGSPVSLSDLSAIAAGRRAVSIPPSALSRVAEARASLEHIMATGRAVYGVNTGFGELASVRISAKRLQSVQRNLVRSHACGVGEELSEEEARGILFLRLNELSRGYSGVRTSLIRHMARMLSSGLTPIIPSRGSVGASGDLAPQAHAALAVIGEGFVMNSS